MKKIIALAAIAAVGAAFGACEGPVEPANCVFAYSVSLSGKSTVAKSATVKESACESNVVCYRKSASFKAKGYIYGTTTAEQGECGETGCGCNEFADVTSYIWNTKTLEKMGDFTFTSLARIGSATFKKATTVEVVGSLDALTLAGFGKYDAKKNYLKSASGYFAGTLAIPKCESCTYNAQVCEDQCDTTDSSAFKICAEEDSDVDAVPAYGKWTVKYNKSAAKKLAKTGEELDVSAIVPAKVLKANAEGEVAP